MFGHKKLAVWREGMNLTIKMYALTSGFPDHTKFGLANQIRRAAGSIPSNISEGVARGSTKEYVRFLRIASGSLSELDTHLELAYSLKYISDDDFITTQEEMKMLCAKLFGLIRSLQQKMDSMNK
jgi:four helix bundle protein